MSAKAMGRACALARLLAIAIMVCAMPTTTWSQALRRDRTPQIGALVDERPGTAIGVALVRNGRVAWTAVVGAQDESTPADANTLFNVASLAKPVTAEVIVRLVQAGEIDLDEAMSDTWLEPDLASDPRHRSLTPRLALSHQAGFPNWRPRNRVLAFERDPGAAFGYSGEGYDYLAHFAEQRTQQCFEDLAQRYVFDALGLTHTGYTWRPWMEDHIAVPPNVDAFPGASGPSMPGRWSAADNLYTTIGDYAAFVARVASSDRLSRELAAERLRVHVTTAGCPTAAPGCPDSVGMALGWMMLSFGDRRFAIHEGGDPGVSTMAYFDVERRDGAVVFISGDGGTPLILEVLEIVDPRSVVLTGFRAAGVR